MLDQDAIIAAIDAVESNALPMRTVSANGAGIDRTKLHGSPGRPKGARNLHAKHPSSLAKRLKLHGVDWVQCLAAAIKAYGDKSFSPAARARARDDVRMWLRALPYLVTTTKTVKVRKWKGKASKAAMVALEALEGR
jgi:hypothetical protein